MFTNRLAAVSLAFASTLMAYPAPAIADTTERDARFLSTMQSLGFRISDPAQLISNAHMVCDEGLAHGVTWQEIQAQIIGWGTKPLDADQFIYNAIGVYCPQYAAMTTDQIHQDMLRH
jgi:hypothetical protein